MGRRLVVLLVLLAAIGIPAVMLQAACAGRSCSSPEGAGVRVPFCPLPAVLRTAIANGYREGRSADVLGVTGAGAVYTDAGGTGVRGPWPDAGTRGSELVPVAFAGAGVAPDASVPPGTGLDALAPTVSEILGFERPFPGVRAGEAIDGVTSGASPRLVLLVAWKGVGSSELRSRPDAWPFLASVLERGAGTLDARTGSLPLDPAATLTTIGTGGLPSQHGITGSTIRNDLGEVVPAFGPGAPVTVIATLADDLEHANPSTLVGLVATDPRDQGIVGDRWYPDEDPVEIHVVQSRDAPTAVQLALRNGYGADPIPDVLAVVLQGPIRSLDGRTRRIVSETERATSSSTLVVVAGTGSAEGRVMALPDDALVEAVEAAVPGPAPVVAATVPGGMFLDQEVLREQRMTGQVAVDAMRSVSGPSDERMLADAFQGFAVSVARFC
jgi:hypothetical protein